MPAAPFEGLSEYPFLLICLELKLKEILSLRQVCRVFGAATQNKLLWMNLLEASHSEGHVLPLYLKSHHLLDAATLEALVLRVARLARRWKLNDICPVKAWRIHLPQSITWLRLVSGSWLFVASSDNEGYTDPIAEAYLPGQVKTARLEVQDAGIVLALGLGPNWPSVHVITLRQHLGSHCFAVLCRIEGSSHIVMLHGNFVGCALRNDAIVPHIINWREKTTYDLPPPPGGFDTVDDRSAPHSFIVWNDSLVVIRHHTLHFYTHPAAVAGPAYIKTFATVEISEVVALEFPSQPLQPLELLVISSSGVELLTLKTDALFPHDLTSSQLLLAAMPGQGRKQPWYRLTANGTGRRALWLSAENTFVDRYPNLYPHIVSMAVSSEADTPRLLWTNDLPHDPALWAFPSIDIDESLGYTVIGNCFGELAVYDAVGFDPLGTCGLAPDFTVQTTTLPPLLSLTPIPLDLQLAPRKPFGATESEPDHSVVSHWTKDGLNLDHRLWCTDMICGEYPDWDQWQGNLGDTAWLLHHAYGFPGTVIPQAHTEGWDADNAYVLLRTGNRYLLFNQKFGEPLGSFPLTLAHPPSVRYAEHQPCLRPTAYTEMLINQRLFAEEFQGRGGRNRWVEQQGRGGRPHKNLVNVFSDEDLMTV
ncbi:hypothetical protein C8R43DRAFT_1243587 [Mycena crocata]|nr:hypothetical protein C8R43DRAFT_1243587 [Mycena crocata]